MSKKRNVKDIYSLSPMQEGMLFHHLLDKQSRDYFEQLCLEICGDLNIELFEKSVQHVVDKYDVFRTVFIHEKVKRPRQVVMKKKEITICFQDISGMAETAQHRFVKDFKAADRARGFDLMRGNTFRVSILKTSSHTYQLIWSYHHIIMDGWSSGLVFNDLLAFYDAFLHHTPLPPSNHQPYGQYIQWIGKQDKQNALSSWRSYLEGLDQPITLPRTGKKANDKNLSRGITSFTLEESASNQIEVLAQTFNVTTNIVFQALWGILLYRYNGCGDVVFGFVVAGRNPEVKGIEQMVGMFMNTIPIRIKMHSHSTFSRLLTQIQKQALQYQKYDYLQLSEIQTTTVLKQDLINHIMIFENYPIMEQIGDESLNRAPGFTINDSQKFWQNKYEFTMLIIPGQSIKIKLVYDNCIFDQFIIENIENHLLQVLGAVSQNPGITLEKIDLLAPREKERLLFEWNDTRTFYPGKKTFHQLFEEQVKNNSHRIGVVYEDKKQTYHALNARSDRLARRLRQQGARPGHIVGLMVERTGEMITGILGILKAGAAYLPIAADYPLERIAFMVKDSHMRILVTQDSFMEKFEPLDLTISILDMDNGAYSDGDENEEDQGPGAKAHDLIYAIYTSGSTGRPKGVLLEHRNLINFLWGMKEAVYNRYTGPLNMGLVSPYVFDASMQHIGISLTDGHALHIVPEDTRVSGIGLIRYYTKYRVDISDGTPTHFRMIVGYLREIGDDFPVKHFVIGGEAFVKELTQRFFNRFGTTPPAITNVYGPTETCINSTTYPVVRGNAGTADILPIGKPLGNQHVVILRGMKLQSIGAPGELCISGHGLARGYLNRPELTDEKFKRAVISHSSFVIDSPLKTNDHPSKLFPNDQCPMTNDRFYKTGDLARWLPDGNIEFLGRIDQQVKLRGFRVETGEIENHLTAHPHVSGAVVAVKKHEDGSGYLCAYYIGDNNLAASELRGHLSVHLPAYMIPSYFTRLDHIPLTASGKINWKELPVPNSHPDTGKTYEAPCTPTENTLVRIWEEVLSLDNKISVHDNFFELGGNSLRAVSLAARLKEEFHVEIPLGKLFEKSTIRELSLYIARKDKKRFFPVKPLEKKDYYEVSSAQKRLYALVRFDKDGITYNIPGALHLLGNLDKKRFEEVFKALVTRHESFRTSFHFPDNQPAQRIRDTVEFSMEYFDPESQESGAKSFINSFIRPFDLSQAPLLRVRLVRETPDKHILMIDVHHIIADGISTNILTKEISEFFNGEAPGALPFQYKDFAVWQNKFLKSEKIEKQKIYWLNRFAGPPPVLAIPTDFPRGSIQQFKGNCLEFTLEEKLGRDLQRLGAQTGATLYMVLLAVFNVLLSKYSGQEDIIIGTPSAGRRRTELEQIVGMFVNTLAMRNYPEPGICFEDFLVKVKQNSLQAFENQDYQFDDLVEHLNLKKDMSRNPLFDTMFAMQNIEETELVFQNLTITPYHLDVKISKFDLILECIEQDRRIMGRFQYDVALFKEETIRQLIFHFQNTAAQVVRHPRETLSAVKILSPEEEKYLLANLNNTETSYPEDKTIHQLFEKQVEHTPDHIALIGPKILTAGNIKSKERGNVFITYKRLSHQSNQLAHVLKENGVMAGRIVGIMVGRSIEMIIGILSILKVGAAYLPIIPGDPAERKRYMLADAACTLLLSQSTYSRLAGSRLNIINLDDAGLYSGKAFNIDDCQYSGSIAYIIYTSGSTGHAKGILTMHFNVTRVVKETNYIEITGNDRLLQLSNYAFDGSVFDIYGALLNGSALVLLTEPKVLDMEQLCRIIRGEQITIFFVTTALFNALVDLNPEALKNTREILFGGERVSVGHCRKALSYLGKGRIIHVYGPTESTVYATYYPIDAIEDNADNIPIGSPLANTRVYVLDKHMMPVPRGVPGELWISGKGLAQGYLNSPPLTAQMFVPNPFIPGERLYRTGDWVKPDHDGNVEFIGRIDSQVKIRGFRIEPGEIETRLLRHPEVNEAVVVPLERKPGDRCLCAYFTAPHSIDTPPLRESLGQCLPDYMIPSYFIQLDRMPLTPNRKINRDALPSPLDDNGYQGRKAYRPPRCRVESKLADTWQEVLQIEKVGIDDSFFELGGDSIKAIRIASKLKEHGMQLEIKDLFQHPTIKKVSTFIKKVRNQSQQGIVTGDVKLTPIQQWFFQRNFTHMHHFNQAVMLYKKDRFQQTIIKQVLEKIVRHHDALRMTYTIDHEREHPGVRQYNRGVEDHLFTLREMDLRHEKNYKKKIETVVNQVQNSFDLTGGPLVNTALFNAPDDDHFLLVIHHLVVDGVSWRILLEDFSTIYNQALKGEIITLPNKTTSFKDWAEELTKYARDETVNRKWLTKEIDYWGKIEAHEITPLPRDREIKRRKLRDTDTVTLSLNREETHRLLKRANRAYNTKINDLLLTALGLTVSQWNRQQEILINLEGHGREEIIRHEQVDITRTVGWFTSQFPVILHITHPDDISLQIRYIKESLRRIPNKGIGYGILKYLTPGDQHALNFSLNPEISFNYLGELDPDPDQPLFSISELPTGENVSLNSEAPFALDINGIVLEGRLALRFRYCKNEYKRETLLMLAEKFKKNLLEIIDHCIDRVGVQLTPSDYWPDILTIPQMEQITKELRKHLGEKVLIDKIYPLTPMQEGMLFHWISGKERSMYFAQNVFDIHGSMNVQLMRKSLEKLVLRHDLFRTLFFYEGITQPVQVVVNQRDVSVYFENISHLEAGKQNLYLDSFKKKDFEKGVDLIGDMLLRVSIFQLGEKLFKVVWSFHHIILDGWCLGIIFNDLFKFYLSLRDNASLQMPRIYPFGNYIRWLNTQDQEEGRRFWRSYLSGYLQTVRIPGKQTSSQDKDKPGTYEYLIFTLEKHLEKKLVTLTTRNAVTLNILFQCAWGILLQRYNNVDDVVFGAVVSGRPPEVEGIEKMVGIFINTIPVRIKTDGTIAFTQLLKYLQKKALETQKYEYYPLGKIQTQVSVDQGIDHDFIDHFIAFENYPISDEAEALVENRLGFSIEMEISTHHMNYDFFIVVSPRTRLDIAFCYNPRVYDKYMMENIKHHLVNVFNWVVQNSELPIETLEILSDRERHNILFHFNGTTADYPKDKTIHQLFEEQVEKNRDAVAVIGPAFSVESAGTNYRSSRGRRKQEIVNLTYKELNRRANRLARRLRKKGTGSDTIVGIMMERSLDLAIGILGILKSGAAYLPIDRELPIDRVISMQDDCRVSLLITQKNAVKKHKFATLQRGYQLTDLNVKLTEKRPQICDFNLIPFPDRSLVDYEKYNQKIGQALVKDSISLQPTRGCPYKCAYCHKVWPKTHVYRSADNVFEELKAYYDMGVRRFAFIDDIFNLNMKNSMRFFDLIIKNGLDVRLFFPNGVRTDLLTRDYIDLMVEAGVVDVAMALETASPRLQKLIKKNLKLDKFRENIEYIIKTYPHVIVELFTMHGFPTENEEEAMMTLNFIKSLKWVDFPWVWILKIFPNTDMGRLALESGILEESIIRSLDLGYHELPETLPWDKSFTKMYQTIYFKDYFLLKERLLNKLPCQMKLLTETEMLQQYNTILPEPVESFSQLLEFFGISPGQLEVKKCLAEDHMFVPNLNEKMSAYFSPGKTGADTDALRVLIVDVSIYFSYDERDVFVEVWEPPLGPMYILTYLKQQFGSRVDCRIIQAEVNFKNYEELKRILDDFKPDVIGMRSLSYYRDFFHETAAIIRQWGIDVPIITGGPYATSSYESVLKDGNIDIVVLGEGEITFAEIIQKVMENNGKLPGDEVLREIAGIAFIPGKMSLERKLAREIFIMDIPGWEGEDEGENLEDINQTADLAYVIFTSGSTGNPKGVAVDHKGVVNMLWARKEEYKMNPKSTSLQLFPYAFDGFITSFFTPVISGVTVILLNEEEIIDIAKIKEIIVKNKVTHFISIPEFYHLIIEALTKEEAVSLRTVTLAGSRLSAKVLALTKEKNENIEIVNEYGVTEGSVLSTLYRHQEKDDTIKIGRPIWNTKIYIIDHQNGIQPMAVPGEMCIAGPGVARGYLNHPELTAERFDHDLWDYWDYHDYMAPFGHINAFGEKSQKVPGKGNLQLSPQYPPHSPHLPHSPYSPYSPIYRTGDLARWLPDGNIELLGRIDHQVKIRGFRIELGEIENRLLEHESIKEVVVTATRGNTPGAAGEREGNENLAAYYVMRSSPGKIPELWPSVAEFFVYDDLLYYAMTSDERRNQSYRKAIERHVKDKIVVEVGPGNEAILARFCVEAGAKKVYAIEILEGTYKKAREKIKELGLEEKITLVHGDATKVELPVKAGVCVSEIVGSIGGSEGAAVILNRVRRLLEPGGVMIPAKSITRIAAVCLPDEIHRSPAFTPLSGEYVEKIFKYVGCKFDLRLCIKHFPKSHIISDIQVFENLDFSGITDEESNHTLHFMIDRESRLDGFLIWLNLYTEPGELIDILEHEHCWLPVFAPVFYPGIDVSPGDIINARCIRTPSKNKINPDFKLSGVLTGENREDMKFYYDLPHIETSYRKGPFYQKLFQSDSIKINNQLINRRHKSSVTAAELKRFLERKLPGHMIPSFFVQLERLPLTPNGKVDRKALKPPEISVEKQESLPHRQVEIQLAGIWADVLELNRGRIDIDVNFFDLGGNSLGIIQVRQKIKETLRMDIPVTTLFRFASIRELAEHLCREAGGADADREITGLSRREQPDDRESKGLAVAVIGMAARFPDAPDISGFWDNLINGREGISFLTKKEVLEAGESKELVENPSYIPAVGILPEPECFDAGFFGYSPQEAALMDPQLRVFHECAWWALEDAGYDPGAYPGAIGLYAGASNNFYWQALNQLKRTDETVNPFTAGLLKSRENLATWVSYKLDLRGPTLFVQSNCSTSLVAIHLASHALHHNECDMALAGGVNVSLPIKRGYLYQEGMVASPDGHCRTFDAEAKGTVAGKGVGVVMLKPLEKALEDGDHIYAVVKGSAINNDGKQKVGYAAPSVEGQVTVIKNAHQMAGTPPETITYIEAHGTGTELGDPVEIEALKLAFNSDKKNFCGIGSVKTNIGHLDAAAGVAGFIKTVLAIKNRCIPPSLYFQTPNPKIDLINSPFYVNSIPQEWETNGTPLIAGVSSFGIGGTNAHVVLEQAPVISHSSSVIGEKRKEKEYQLILLSAKTETALGQMIQNLIKYFKKNFLNHGNHKNPINPGQNPGINMADVAYTLQVGRRAFKYRKALVCRDAADAIQQLSSPGAHQDPASISNPGADRDQDTLYLLKQTASQWLSGISIDWNEFYREEQGRRVSLPHYPFERQHFKTNRKLLNLRDAMPPVSSMPERKTDMADWLYVPAWEQTPLTPGEALESGESVNWLLFLDNYGLGKKLAKRLEPEAAHVITVKIGTTFKKIGEKSYIIDPSQDNHYDDLFKELRQLKQVPHRIVHLWSVEKTSDKVPELQELDRIQDLAFYSLLYTVQAIGNQGITGEIQLLTVTNNVQEVVGGEVLAPWKATGMGAIKVIPLEYPNLKCCGFDIVLTAPKSHYEDKLIDHLLEEARSVSPDPVVALRGNYRWVRKVKPLRLEKSKKKTPYLREKGVYLVTGGLGGMGLTLAGHLAKSVRARLILVGRSPFPEAGQWEQWLTTHPGTDPVSKKIRQLQEMKACGAEVMISSADVSDFRQMRQVVARAGERFGLINGILHTAGIADYHGVIQRRTRQMTESVMAPKVKGMLVLHYIMKNSPVDFLALFSSLATIIYSVQFGQSGYSAANEFLDAFAYYNNSVNGTFTATINWNNWREVGMAVDAIGRQGKKVKNDTGRKGGSHFGLLPREGIEVFDRIMENRFPQVAVSTGDLHELMQSANTHQRSTPPEETLEESGAVIMAQRPDLTTAYAAPVTGTQKQLVEIWQNFFAVRDIGIDDDFYELGGDSLKAMSISVEIHKTLKIKIPLVELFKSHSIKKLAQYIHPKADSQQYQPIEPAPIQETYPLSPIQKRLYIYQQNHVHSTAFNLSGAYIVKGSLDVEKFSNAFRTLIRRHQSLRTSFHAIDREILQKIHDKIDFKVEYQRTPETKAKEKINDFIKPFDLGSAPLFRVKLIQVEEEKYYFFMEMHHIISDFDSMAIMIDEFYALYDGKPMEPPPIQYKDYAAWINQVSHPDHEEQKHLETYWLKKLEHFTFTRIPPDRIQSHNPVKGKFETLVIDSPLYEKLETFCSRSEITRFVFMIAVFNIILSREIQQQDLTIGTPVSLREHLNLKKVFGICLNVLLIRTIIDSRDTVLDHLYKTKETMLEALENKHYPYEHLYDKIKQNNRGKTENNELISIYFDYLPKVGNGARNEREKASREFEMSPIDIREISPRYGYDITLYISEWADAMSLKLVYNSCLYKKETIENLLKNFLRVIPQVLDNENAALADINPDGVIGEDDSQNNAPGFEKHKNNEDRGARYKAINKKQKKEEIDGSI